jgi:hypothetical protein
MRVILGDALYKLVVFLVRSYGILMATNMQATSRALGSLDIISIGTFKGRLLA